MSRQVLVKVCTMCGAEKSIDEFANKTALKKRSYCKPCYNEITKKRGSRFMGTAKTYAAIQKRDESRAAPPAKEAALLAVFATRDDRAKKDHECTVLLGRNAMATISMAFYSEIAEFDPETATWLKLREKRQKKEGRLMLKSYLGNACKWCGECRPQCLEFDHVYNNGATSRATNTILWDEINEIQLLCITCNRLKQYYARKFRIIKGLEIRRDDVFNMFGYPKGAAE